MATPALTLALRGRHPHPSASPAQPGEAPTTPPTTRHASPTPSGPRVPAERAWVERLARSFPVVDVIREDRQTNGGLAQPGCQTVIAHRLASWARSDDAPRPLRRPVEKAARAALWVSKSVYGIEVPAETRLGRRVRLAHQGGIVVHRDAVIGDDVLIRQNVTIGLRGDVEGDQTEHVPHVLDGAQLGAGAVVVGPVTVGPGAVVGANAVVTRDVPAGGTAVAAKGTIVKPAPEA